MFEGKTRAVIQLISGHTLHLDDPVNPINSDYLVHNSSQFPSGEGNANETSVQFIKDSDS